jgi:transposase
MTRDTVFVGIDVSKDRLDVFVEGETFHVENSKAGIKSLQKRLGAWAGRELCLGLEASGGYEALVLQILAHAGLTTYRVEAGRVRSFAKATGHHAKTDPIDARMVARYLETCREHLVAYKPQPGLEHLAELVRYRRSIVERETALRASADRRRDPVVAKIAKRELARLKADLREIERAIAARIAAEPDLAQRNRILQSAPGVGPVLAATLVSEMPELGETDSRSVAALVGVAPYDRQSGRSRRPGRCRAGRGQVRKVLYMAALAAIRTGGNRFSKTYEHLTRRGKPAKLAINAVMRKMIVTLNAMLKGDAVWAA